MTEGTKSYLIGCHQFLLHPLFVFMAWRLEYKSWPKWWEIVCIFLHDVGICGRQYLSDDKAKQGHWFKGAYIVGSIFGYGKYNRDHTQLVFTDKPVLKRETFILCAGHCPKESGYMESKLSRADKRSWLVAPMWWLWWNYWVEKFITEPHEWKRLVAKNLKNKNPIGSHELYLKYTRKQP